MFLIILHQNTENQVDDSTSAYNKTDCIINFETDNSKFNNYEDCLKDNIELNYEEYVEVVTSIDVPGNISNEKNLNVPNKLHQLLKIKLMTVFITRLTV